MVLSPLFLPGVLVVAPTALHLCVGLTVALVPGGALLALANMLWAARKNRAQPERPPILMRKLSSPLVVVAGYLALALFVSWSVRDRDEDARPDIARVQAWDIAKAADLYRINTGRYPDALDDLVRPPPPVRRPIMERIPLDPWDRSFRYVVTTGTVTLCSDGEDGRPDTDDDLCVLTSSTSRGIRDLTR